jgi:hypothetical protein
MTRHTVGVLIVVALAAACTGRSQPPLQPAVPQPQALGIPALVFPDIDAPILDSLSALLGRVAQDSSLLSALDPSGPRMYALFRELEAAQERFAIALATPDSTGQTLYDRLKTFTARNDSLFRELETRNRQAPRP